MGRRIGRIDAGLRCLGGHWPTSVDEHGRDHTTDRRRGYDGASGGSLTRFESTGDDPMGWFPC